MASDPYRGRPEAERAFERQELMEGWLAVAAQAISLLLAASFVVIVAVCALEGDDWRVVASLGATSAALARAARAVARRRSRR